MLENELGVSLYTYTVATGVLELTEALTNSPAGEVKFEDHYVDPSKFIAEYKSGTLNFYELPTTTPDQILKKIELMKAETNVELLLRSSILTGQPDIKSPSEASGPKSDLVDTTKLPGDYVRMKKGEVIDLIHITKFEAAVADGWVPTKKEYRDYPIILDPTTNKIKFTCFEAETIKYAAEGLVVIRFK